MLRHQQLTGGTGLGQFLLQLGEGGLQIFRLQSLIGHLLLEAFGKPLVAPVTRQRGADQVVTAAPDLPMSSAISSTATPLV
jgi:hypothetical protein